MNWRPHIGTGRPAASGVAWTANVRISNPAEGPHDAERTVMVCSQNQNREDTSGNISLTAPLPDLQDMKQESMSSKWQNEVQITHLVASL